MAACYADTHPHCHIEARATALLIKDLLRNRRYLVSSSEGDDADVDGGVRYILLPKGGMLATEKFTLLVPQYRQVRFALYSRA
jgi:hypothetical protein